MRLVNKIDDMKTDEMVLLLAKIGSFFANCDGEYSDDEKVFITNYIQTMRSNSVLSDSTEIQLLETTNHNISYNEIISDTENLLKDFNPTEQHAIIKSISDFIQKVIEADNHVNKNEELYFKQWSNHFNSFLKN